MSTNGYDSGEATRYPELDVQKLHSLPSEQQDLYLLTFSSDLTRHVATLDADGASAQQIYVKKELFKVINLSSPSTTRVIRNNLGQCFAGVFSKGDRKLLFESVNDLITIIGKADKDLKIRHTAIHCLGALFEAAGDSAISLSSLACAIVIRQSKAAQNHTGLRAALFTALGRIVKGVGPSADEAVVRDVWRQARTAATGDKSYLVQSSACWCATQIVQYTSYLDNTNDFEKLQTLVWRSMESGSPTVRRTAASCLAITLIQAYSAAPRSVAPMKKQKKSKKTAQDQDDLEEQQERASSPAPTKGVVGISLGLNEILKLLSVQYCRTSSNRVRSAIALCYAEILRGLDESIIVTMYTVIVRHFIDDILSSPGILNNRYRLLITRRFTRMILADVVGGKLLGESGQLDAVKFLVNGILKDYPQSDVKERPEPSKEVLVIALDLLASLIEGLGSATNNLSDLCREGLFQVLPHFSHTVQIHASRCLQSLVLSCPHQLLPSVTICMNSVNREVSLLTGPRKSPRRCLGFAYGLAAALSTSSSQPLYGSVEVYSRILSHATTILKSSSSADLRISSAQIQVAWILIGGLMSLGPNFVKIHLSQLLMLWKNALPKPLSKDNIGNRGLLELSFLAHVRECSLGAMQAFLTFNSRLLTLDVSKRLATMLQNTAMFLSSLPPKKTTDDNDRLLTRSLQLQDYELMVRRRLYECYGQLISQSPQGSQEALIQSNILSIAASSFANPVAVQSGSISSSIAASAATFESIWEVGDNSAFGLNGLVRGLKIDSALSASSTQQPYWIVQRNFEAMVDSVILSPTCGDWEHDSLKTYADRKARPPDPAATDVVNSATCLFAICLPLQPPKIQQGVLEQISTLLANSQQSAARVIAITINLAMALYLTMQVAARETLYAAGDMRTPEVEKALQELLHSFIVNPDGGVRRLGAEALGRLCKTAGSDFTAREVNHLVELIVANREPHVRAGCAAALGSIHSELGGMAAGYHLKNIVGVLSSLSSDPHPTVHFWALEALCKVADSAGLAYSPFVSSTLGMLAQLYTLESHNEETASTASSNLELDFPTSSVIARCIDSMINALGPDLQDQAKTRNMILTLTYQFQLETSPVMMSESLTCLEHLSMYAPGHISFAPYVRQLHAKMTSEDPDVRDTALTGLYNAMRKGAEEVIRDADPALEEQLWLTLHEMYGQGIARNIIQDWVDQSGFLRTDLWIRRIQTILTKVRPSKTSAVQSRVSTTGANGVVDMQDEEAAGFNAMASTDANGTGSAAETSQELLRWQVRCTAMGCLHDILSRVVKEATTQEDSSSTTKLQPLIGDIVRIAFSASTAEVIEMRILGIQIIGQILHIFGRVPDPEFPEVTLLEQYQAQISSALTPAFASDSSPVLAAEAVGVCASFISTGIVTDVERMGRILRLLVKALEDFSKDSESASIGELKDLSSNAQIMVKLAVFSAWAELQIASQEHIYLDDVVRPHLEELTPLWLVLLREYARLKFEPDVSSTSAPTALTGGLDMIYAALNRETLLQFYQSSWLKFVDAIASLIDEDSDFVFNALEGKDNADRSNGATKTDHDISYRDEPVAFFFVLFGIAFEALVSTSGESRTNSQRTLEILQAMKKILNPAVAGRAIYQDVIFSEAMDLFDRLVLTESLEVQAVIVEIAQNLCLGHHAARRPADAQESEEDLSDDIDQLFELTRILVLVISNHVPNVSEHAFSGHVRLTDESTNLIVLALNALVDSAEVFPAVIKSDLHACILHIFATILSTGDCQETLVPLSLPIFRRFITGLIRHPQYETVAQLRSALARFLSVLKNAQRQDSAAALPCERNTLLASTILLTSSAKLLPAADDLITNFLDELAGCLSNRSTTKVAAGLSRSLLLLPSGASNPPTAEQSIVSQLLPHLLDFISNPAEAEGTEETRPVISQALLTFVLAVSPTQRALALSLVVPALLKRADTEGKPVWGETSVALTQLAGKDPEMFRAVVGRMDAEQRAFVEEVIRFGSVGARGTAADAKDGNEDVQDKAPTIALKLNF